MPVHVDEISSEVGVMDGELPLTETQIESLVRIVLERLETRQRDAELSRDEARIRTSRVPWLDTAD